VFDGTKFSVLTGPQKGDSYEWLKVRLEGWVAANWLSGEPRVGASVTVKDTGNLGLWVREKYGLEGNVIGKVFDETRLMILEGPVSSHGYQW